MNPLHHYTSNCFSLFMLHVSNLCFSAKTFRLTGLEIHHVVSYKFCQTSNLQCVPCYNTSPSCNLIGISKKYSKKNTACKCFHIMI